MNALNKVKIVGKKIDEILFIEQHLLSGGVVNEFFLVLDSRLIVQLLPYGLRVHQSPPGSATQDRSPEAAQCLSKAITAVITDTCFYYPACLDDLLRNPPYDDVYLILDEVNWLANRFFEKGENSLTVDDKKELRNLSENYFDYWTREEVSLDSLLR